MKVFAALFLLAAMAGGSAWAEDAKPDGEWHGNGAAALSLATGNTRNSSLTLSADGARQTESNKLSLYGQTLVSRAGSTVNGVSSTRTTANQWVAGTRYDHNLSDRTFGFGGLDFNHDQIQLLGLRSVVSAGLGYHAIKSPETQWDLLAGVSYRADQYSGPGVSINNQLRTSFKTAGLLLGEESTSKLSESTTFKQRLTASPNLNKDRGALINFDTSLMVAMSRTLSLKVSLQDRYNTLSQAPIKKNDLLFFTGINVKF